MTENLELVNKYGEPLRFDRNFQGPRRRNRNCTDVPCLLLFVLFLCGWAYIAQYAIRNGNLDELTTPTDMFNRKCGLDSGVLNKNYLFFFDLKKCIDPLVPITGCDTPQVCVERCPTETFIYNEMKNSLNFEQLKSRLICQTDEIKAGIGSKSDIENAISKNLCASYYVNSVPIFNRCMFDFPEVLCGVINSLPSRSRRGADLLLPGNVTQWDELHLRAMALTMQDETQAQKRVATETGQSSRQLAVKESENQCRRQQQNGEIIKKKMELTDTLLAKLVGGFLSKFATSTHDAQRLGEEIVEDLINSSTVVLLAIFFTLIASLVFISLMRWLATPILWLSIVGVLSALATATYFSFEQYKYYNATPRVPLHDFNLYNKLQNIWQNPNTWLYLAIFLCVIFVIMLLLIIVLRERIRIAIALTKEGSKAVSSMISTTFFPIFSWVLYILAIAFAIGVGLYIGSIGTKSFRMVLQRNEAGVVSTEKCVCEGVAINYTVGAACDPKIFNDHCHIQYRHDACIETTCSFSELNNPRLIKGFIAYNVIGFIWLSFFISAFSDMVLAATFARWYWTFKKRDVPYFTLTEAFFQTLFFHLGTVAFGSLILTICRVIRLVLEYIDHKVKKYDNALTRAILCCMRCFFWLLETFLKFLNRNAYIMCAIHGKNFCTSAADAFNLIMRNVLRVAVLDKVTDFLFFLSKILITAGAGVSTYYFLVNNPHLIQVNHNFVPTAVVVVAAFLISSVFFGVYSMAVDTLLLCFLEDIERNDGTPEKPFFMSRQLGTILGKKNKFPKRQLRNK